LFLLAVPVCCGLVAMLGVQQAISDNKTEPKNMVTVLVATADIMAGSRLDETNSRFEEFDRATCPPGVVTSREECEDRALKVRIFRGDKDPAGQNERKRQLRAGRRNSAPVCAW